MDSALVIDPQLVTDALSSLALNTLSAFQNGVPVKWHDAELAVYLVFIFGEINKSALFSLVRRIHVTHILSSWRTRTVSVLPNACCCRKREEKGHGLL